MKNTYTKKMVYQKKKDEKRTKTLKIRVTLNSKVPMVKNVL